MKADASSCPIWIQVMFFILVVSAMIIAVYMRSKQLITGSNSFSIVVGGLFFGGFALIILAGVKAEYVATLGTFGGTLAGYLFGKKDKNGGDS